MHPNQLNNSTLETIGQLKTRAFYLPEASPLAFGRGSGGDGVCVAELGEILSSHMPLFTDRGRPDGRIEVGQTFLQIPCPRRLK